MNDKTKNLGKYAIRGGPGRPKGSVSGRTKLIVELDKILAKPKNRKKIREILQQYLDDETLKFYKEIAAPLLPKDIKHDLAEDLKEHGLPIEIIRERLLNALEQKRDDSSSDTDGQ